MAPCPLLPEMASANPSLIERALFPAAGDYTLFFPHVPKHSVC